MEYKDIIKNRLASAALKEKVKKIFIEEIEQNATDMKRLDKIYQPLTTLVTNIKRDVDQKFEDNSSDLKALLKIKDKPKDVNSTAIIPYVHEIAKQRAKAEQFKMVPDNFNDLGEIAQRALRERNDESFGFKGLKDPQTGAVEFYFGNKIVHFVGDDFYFDAKKYNGTRGLWELVTLKQPTLIIGADKHSYEYIRQVDLDNYLEMVEISQIHLSPTNHLRSNKGYKYITFIAPWYAKTQKKTFYVRTPSRPKNVADVTLRDRKIKHRTSSVDSYRDGSGIEFLSSNPNELIKELRILLANLQVGHTNVDYNKVSRIAEELFRLKKITKKVYTSIQLKKFGNKSY